MSSIFHIGARKVGGGEAPFVVAELSANHNGSKDAALRLIGAAAAAGADAVKFQTYTPDSMTLDLGSGGYVIPSGPWAGRSLYGLYEEAQTPWDWHQDLFEEARRNGIVAFSSPFDPEALSLLEDLGCPCYKIASFELVDIPLIRACAATGKPLIISTGMATFEEVGSAVDAAREAGGQDIALLHAVSAYPTPVEEANLRRIVDLRESFGLPVGLSDHTMGVEVAALAVALGVCLIEKHLTLSREHPGPDSGFSLEPDEFARLVKTCRVAHAALGPPGVAGSVSEQENRSLRRSLYVVEDVEAGQTLTQENVRVLRPAGGLPPMFYDDVLGRRVKQRVERGTPLSLELLEDPPED